MVMTIKKRMRCCLAELLSSVICRIVTIFVCVCGACVPFSASILRILGSLEFACDLLAVAPGTCSLSRRAASSRSSSGGTGRRCAGSCRDLRKNRLACFSRRPPKPCHDPTFHSIARPLIESLASRADRGLDLPTRRLIHDPM